MRNLCRISRGGLFLAMILMLGSTIARAELSVEFGVFYDNLAPYGTWIDHPRYQRVWIPRGMPAAWRPYTHGHWVMTQQYGWTWVSDYEWGWAPFHYGRWAFDNRYGWLWVPGQVWGPGWVAWRSGGDYIGWAPLPPEAGWDDEYGIRYTNHDEYYGIASIHWIFIQERYFVTPRLHRYIYAPSRNTTILRTTSNITQFRVVDHRIVNQCIPVRRIEQVTRRPVRVLHVNEFDDQHRWRESHANTDRVNIYRPRIQRVETVEPLRRQQLATPPQRHIINERHEEVYRFGEQPTNKSPQQPRTEPRREEPREPRQEIHRFGEQPINKSPQQPRAEPRREEPREQRHPQQETPRLGGQPSYQTQPRVVPRQEPPRDQQEIKGVRTNPALGGAVPQRQEHQQERKSDKQQQKAEREAKKKHQREEQKNEKQEQQENTKKSFGRDDDRR